jgi:predicted transcriptional regulator
MGTGETPDTTFFIEGAMFRVVLSLDKKNLAYTSSIQKETELTWHAVRECVNELERLGVVKTFKDGNKRIVEKDAHFQELADAMYNVKLIVKGMNDEDKF